MVRTYKAHYTNGDVSVILEYSGEKGLMNAMAVALALVRYGKPYKIEKVEG